ncbi:MAG: hypothetical protein JWN30_2446 [Bacilli bacterium]|nr:hypothetical protein [Bacilli bacterium]
MPFRIERDTIGEVNVQQDKFWGEAVIKSEIITVTQFDEIVKPEI